LVESVVWIAELKNTLSLPPFLLAMCFLIEYENHHRPRDYYFALTAYVIAMLCKISMAPFPAAILLYAWWRRGRLEWKDVRVNLPFWGAAFFLTLLSIWCGQVYAVIHRMDITFTTGGVPFRIAIIGQTLAFYLATCLWPFGLQPMYVRWPLEHPTLLQFLPWPMTAGAIYWFWINRTTWGRHALLGFGFFCLFIAPFLGVVIASYMRLTWVMDHFVYIAIIGLIGLVVAGLEGLSRRYSRAGETLLCTAVAVSAVGLAISSHWYSGMFVDQTKLWNYAIVENPKAYTAYNNLGAIIIKDGQYEKALAAIDKAIEYYPDYFEAHYNRGLALQHLGRPDEALQEYRKATELSPASTQARLVYAGALEAGGDPFNAIHQYEFAAEENPDSAEIHAALGALLIRIGRIPDAAHEFSETVRIDPNSATSHNDLGNALYLMGQREAAIDEYQEALRFNPNLVEAHNNLGGALQEAGQFDEAVKEFDVAVSLAPTDAKLIANLATAVLKAGHRDEAIKLYELALHYDPTNDSAREDLAIVTGKAPLPPPPLPPAAQ
jgi:tetratricopeptide (TPR) repeat protein